MYATLHEASASLRCRFPDFQDSIDPRSGSSMSRGKDQKLVKILVSRDRRGSFLRAQENNWNDSGEKEMFSQIFGGRILSSILRVFPARRPSPRPPDGCLNLVASVICERLA